MSDTLLPMRRTLACVLLSAFFGFALSQDLPDSPPEPDMLAHVMPNGNFVLVTVKIAFNQSGSDYVCFVFDPAGKKLHAIDAAPLWGGEFVPEILCPLDNDRVLVLDEAPGNKRRAVVFDLRSGKIVKRSTFPMGFVWRMELMSDGSLLAHLPGELVDLDADGKVLWRKSQLTGPDGKAESVAYVDDIRTMPGGKMAILEERLKRIRIVDSNFKPLQSISLVGLDKLGLTQDFVPGKGGFWVQVFSEGDVEKVDLAGKASPKRQIVFSDGSELDWANFVGETSDGDPIIQLDGLFRVTPDGKAVPLDPAFEIGNLECSIF